MHINCPHCHNSAEVVGATPHEVACPACGTPLCPDGVATVTAEGPLPPMPRVGRFWLVELLGQGGFGSVWRARDPDLARDVAVKLPRPGVLGGPEYEERFLRELRALANLRHDGIVTVHEGGRQDGSLYIVSDFISGVNLAEWLSGRRMQFREAAELMAAIADAVHYAHSKGVVHRDLKPANIMLDESGRPHITDFGLAKREGAEMPITREGRHLGTPAYMSPEQARGQSHRADARSDVWSLGVVLYELLTGERPYRGAERMILLQILNDEARTPRFLDDRIPRDLETITIKCLQKQPERRYQSAADLALELRRWLRGEPIQSRPISRLERLWRWTKRNPRIASLIALVVLLALGSCSAAILIAEQKHQAGLAQQNAAAAEKLARRLLYCSDMNLAQIAWKANLVGTVRNFLDRHRDHEIRDFEWYYWQRQSQAELGTLLGHHDVVWCLAFSPDGTRLASAGRDKNVIIWNTADIREPHPEKTLPAHSTWVRSLAFSPDGRLFASAEKAGMVKIWDTTDWQELRSIDAQTKELWSIAFNWDGTLLATSGIDRNIRVWDVATGDRTQVLRGDRRGHRCIQFARNEPWLVAGDDTGTIHMWDLGANEPIHRLPIAPGDPIMALSFSGDGSMLAIASERTVSVWDFVARTPLRKLAGHSKPNVSVAFSPDQTQIASAGEDGTVIQWDVATGEPILVRRGHQGRVRSVLFHPNGKVMASAGQDHSVRIWDLVHPTVQEPLTLRGHTETVWRVQFSPKQGRLASIGGDRTVRLWDLATGTQIDTNIKTTGRRSLAFSPDGTLLATQGTEQTVTLYDTQSGTVVKSLNGAPASISGIVFSGDGALAAASGPTAVVWQVSTGERAEIPIAADSTNGLAFSPAADQLALAGEDGSVHVWNLANRTSVILAGHGEPVRSVAYSPLGYLASGSEDDTVKIWDVPRAREIATLRGHTRAVEWVTFNSSGTRLASASRDTTVKLWDTSTWIETLTLDTHAAWVRTVAFDPNGHYLATAGNDMTIRVWDARPAE